MNTPVLEVDLDDGPTDLEIVELVSQMFDMTQKEAIERLICMDFVTARRGLN